MARKKVAKKKEPALKSGFEKKGAAYLKERGVPFEYESTKVPYVVPAKKKNYIPDFVLPNGIFVELKGKLDRDVREKMALVVEQNPDLDIRMLFMRNNKIAKNSKTRYSDWCEKRGIVYAVSEAGQIPEEWISDALRSSSLDADPVERPAAPAAKAARKRKVGAVSVPRPRPSLDPSTD